MSSNDSPNIIKVFLVKAFSKGKTTGNPADFKVRFFSPKQEVGGQMFVDVSDGVRVGGYGVTFGERKL